MPEAIPCVSTIQSLLYTEYRPIQEGEFRFDALLQHLERYNACKAISIGEDATRLISRVDYDSETDSLVGFVLPCTEDGVPSNNFFKATSFETIQLAFRDGEFARYAFVYMAQSFTKSVPAFCLACIGTNNKFTAELVLKRWLYIYTECKKRGITVVSYGADGDSRELKSMQVSTNLLFSANNPLFSLSPSNISEKLSIPTDWRPWYGAKTQTAICYVQDVVHIAVKLKSRLIKPSIVLPLGNYVAGVHHLRIVQTTFKKDEHGLRERDINHKDKQNYEAVLRMTSASMFKLLDKIPDSQGTVAYLFALRSVVDSYLDKTIDPLTKIKKAWYGVFFMRYWRQWILLNPNYTLGNNFITLNAYMCIELNAHALIVFLLTLQQLGIKDVFHPWLLGSQSCEKAFRAVRSMSSVFSTVINFGMLGLLRRLHRLHIQFSLESESQETGIKYPRREDHKHKDGHGKSMQPYVGAINPKQIAEVVEQAKQQAKSTVKDLGMADLLEANECLDNPPSPLLNECDYEDGDDDDDEAEEDGKTCTEALTTELLQEINLPEEGEVVASGIQNLQDVGLISKQQSNTLTEKHQKTFKKVSTDTVSLFEETNKVVRSKRKHSPFVKVQQNGKELFVSKTTVVWLLQEGERVSTDRLFRVRNKQPFTTENAKIVSHVHTDCLPKYSNEIYIGDICVFSMSGFPTWRVGKVLKFSYYKNKTKSSQQYRGNAAKVSDTVGVLCTWYSRQNEFICSDTSVSTSEMSSQSQDIEVIHVYIPISAYLCTLSHECFIPDIEKDDNGSKSILPSGTSSHDLFVATAKKLALKASALSNIDDMFEARKAVDCTDPAKIKEDVSIEMQKEECWVHYGGHRLTRRHLQQLLQGKKLCDIHINAFQCLLKNLYSNVDGLQCTLFQDRTPIKRTVGNILVQIIHIGDNHWGTIAVIGDEICLYDSKYSSVSDDTLATIANLIRSTEPSFTVKCMNVSKQTGAADCGVYAVAMATSLILGEDPTTIVFNQDELREHYCRCAEKEAVSSFPFKKKRRPASRFYSERVCKVYCYCRLPDNGNLMASCSKCNDWFHEHCIDEPIPECEFTCKNCTV